MIASPPSTRQENHALQILKFQINLSATLDVPYDKYIAVSQNIDFYMRDEVPHHPTGLK